MYIIDKDYFVRELSVPNVNETNSESRATLEQFIDDKSRLLLQGALGFKNFKEFDSHVTDGVLDALAPQKWLDLVNGADYTKGNSEYRWNGLAYAEGSLKKSLLAKFTFAEWLRFNTTVMSGVGEVSLSATNANNATSNYRLVNVWNSFLAEYQGTNVRGGDMPFIGHKDNAIYMDWMGGNNDSGVVNMLTFLRDHREDYPNINGRVYPMMNYYGL